FFISSRRRHTRSKRDWSSDVCSSDLGSTSFRAHFWTLCPEVRDGAFHLVPPHIPAGRGLPGEQLHPGYIAHEGHDLITGLVWLRSEERRVGNGGRCLSEVLRPNITDG